MQQQQPKCVQYADQITQSGVHVFKFSNDRIQNGNNVENWAVKSLFPAFHDSSHGRFLSMHHFPFGHVVHTLRHRFPHVCSAYRRRDGMLVSCFIRESDPDEKDCFISCFEMNEHGVLRFICNIADVRRCNHIAISEGDKYALVHDRALQIHQFRNRHHLNLYGVPKGERCLLAAFINENEVLMSTSEGFIYRFDFRAALKSAIWAIVPNRKSKDITCMRVAKDKNRLFVSNAVNEKQGNGALTLWDMRYSSFPNSIKNTPVLQFEGHVGCSRQEFHDEGCRELSFALEEEKSGGMLVAGGRDGLVRIWDARKGGNPIERIGIPEVINEDNWPRRVELVSWNDGVDNNRFGFWLSTKTSFISCAAGGTGRRN